MIDEWRDAAWEAASPAIGAVAPHAGWVFSGSTAAMSLAGVARYEPETVIVHGAVHVLDRNDASLYLTGCWETPFGDCLIDEELSARIAEHPRVTVDSRIHDNEHSIEVELPFIKRFAPNARIVALMVRPGPHAVDIGRHCAECAIELGRRVAVVASTDLTHYGPAFGFEPHGRGREGVLWAKNVNDRRMIDLIGTMSPDGILPEAAEHHNSCGPGAVAATIEAARVLGAARYDELQHTTSAEQSPQSMWDLHNSVGYEAGIFLKH
jgi:AmmeMemoRadiSam system protein B